MANRLSVTIRGETLADKVTSDVPPIWNQDTTGTANTATTTTHISGGKYGCIPYQAGVSTTTMLNIGRVGEVLAVDTDGALSWVNNIAVGVAGGKTGQVLYQSGPNITSFTSTGDIGQVLTLNNDKVPVWEDIISTTTINIKGGAAGQLLYQTNTGSTSFTTTGSVGQILSVNKFGVPDWIDFNSSANNIIGGRAGQVLYQAGTGITSFTTIGTPGQALILNNNGVPEWSDIVTANITSSTSTSSTSGGTATGVFALKSNTTGVGNDAHGYSALRSNTTGSNNSSYGYNSLKLNTAGDNNIALGSSALQSNTTGSNNTAIGKQALQDNTTGNGNIAISPCDSKGAYNPVFNSTTESNRLCLGSLNITNAYVSVPWTTRSDERDQIYVEDLQLGLAFVAKLRPTQYQFTDTRKSTASTGIVRYGFSAQAVLDIDNTAHIIDSEDADNLKINESSLIAVLVKAIQELQIEVNQLKQAGSRTKSNKTT
jgi:hypothetical protein